MSNISDLISSFKKISLETFEASKPVNLVYGNVISTSPLEILVEQKLTLKSNQLICVDFGENPIQNGDLLVLLRQQGGQKYLILNRVVEI